MSDNTEYSLPILSKKAFESSKKKLSMYGDDRVCNNNIIFENAIGATYSSNYSYASLKRTHLTECIFKTANFTGAAITGSKFIKTTFDDCTIEGANLQCCDFVEVAFHNGEKGNKFENSTFSESTFYNCTFKNIYFYKSTIYNSLFYNCKFENCTIRTTTLEGTKFHQCRFYEVDLSNLNIDYTIFLEPTMNNVTLPFYQVAYIINGMSYLFNTNDEVWLASEKSELKKIDLIEYKTLRKDLMAYYLGMNEYFPLANLYLSKNKVSAAFACVKEGIFRALRINDFRLIKHYCRLLTSTAVFQTNHIKDIYTMINEYYVPENMTLYETHNYINNISEIRNLLLNSDFNTSSLEIIIKTNIDSKDSEKISEFLKVITPKIDEIFGESRSQYIELRHNSDYTILINCANVISELMPILVSVYSLFGVIDKAVKFRNTILDNKLKAADLKQKTATQTSDNEKNNIAEQEMKKLKKELKKELEKELKKERKLLREQNKELRKSVSELTHYIKNTSDTEIQTEMLYSKTKVTASEEN